MCHFIESTLFHVGCYFELVLRGRTLRTAVFFMCVYVCMCMCDVQSSLFYYKDYFKHNSEKLK